MSSSPLSPHQKIWLDKPKYDAAEKRYYENLAKSSETAKVMNSSIVSNQQDNSDLIEGQDVEANLNNSCSISDQISPTTIHDKLNKSEDALTKSQKTEVCSPKKKDDNKPSCATKHDLSNLDLKEGLCCAMVHKTQKVQDVSNKQAELLPNSSHKPKSVSFDKQIETESKSSQASKVDVGSKSEKPKKSDAHTRDNKSEILANIKVETGESTCSKVKGQSKAKVADDKGTCVDPVSDVMKGVSQNSNTWNSLAGEVAKARQHIKNSLQCIDDIAVTSNTVSVEITNRLSSLEKENVDLKNQVSELVDLLKKMDLRISSLEKSGAGPSKPAAPAPAPHPKKDDAEDDDGVDLFGSDSEEEDTEAAKIKEQRLAEYAAKKAKKPVLIAKSNIILDVKPWDDETNMKELEAEVRKITTDGLIWGASKLVPLAYGIHKLQISCVVEDDKVSVDWLQETIQEVEEYVQSVDIAAFNKV